MNPSAVPVEKGLGAETIYFSNQFDFAIVKGLGRVGAALSATNGEETFFGPPGFELPEDLLERKQKQKKYISQKLTLATAFNILSNKRQGLKRFDVNLGAVAKYNKFTQRVLPGAGLSTVAGPFSIGYSVANDETQLDYSVYGLTQKPIVPYTVETYSVGLSLTNLAIDYSSLRMIATDITSVTVATASLIMPRGMITASLRTETSDRPAYNYEEKTLEALKVKKEIFGGVQVGVTENILLGAFYNYYLLREISAGATIFF